MAPFDGAAPSCGLYSSELGSPSIGIDTLCECLHIANGSDQDRTGILELIAQTLSLEIGDRAFDSGGRNPSGISRSIDALGLRSSLLTVILNIMIGEDQASTDCLLTMGLRERVYATAFDYFIVAPQTPTQAKTQLKNDVDNVIDFWHAVHQDSKRLTKEMFSLADASTSSISKDDLEAEKKLKTFVQNLHLLLLLLADEIERLRCWIDPLDEDGARVDPVIAAWMEKTFPGINKRKTIREIAGLAWDISPQVAIHLPDRFRTSDTWRVELQALIRMDPEVVEYLSDALPLLLGDSAFFKEDTITHILTWERCPVIAALSLLNPRQYPHHTVTVQYAVRVLRSYHPNDLLLYIPQLVQAVRYDSTGLVSELLLWMAGRSQQVAHQLLWNMKTNMFIDEEHKDPVLFDALTTVINKIIAGMEPSAKRFYENEFTTIWRLTEISRTIKCFPKGHKREEACLKALAEVRLNQFTYLPSSPEAALLGIDYTSGTPMQSAARAPFLARFKVKLLDSAKLEKFALEDTSNPLDIEVQHYSWKAAIFKVGDDVRQDMLALQLMTIMKDIFDTSGVKVSLFPYRVVVTAPGRGVIECVPNAKSRDQLGKQTNYLYAYFLSTFGDEQSERFQKARRNFVRSMAAYSVFTFLLQVKDRHNGNILIDSEGHIIHIDFGYMFESSPAGNISFEPDFKLSHEMVMIMGGSFDAEPMRQFTALCIQAYLALRPYREDFVTLVSLMLDTGLPCFRGRTIQEFRARFSPNLSDREAANYMRRVVQNCFLSKRSKLYDMVQYHQQQIHY
ncbi:hypothetical protein QR680_017880 [Steinernema hermaphroditum]|uniref:1-phosphatidylinositol 4-kinase n=1 Tax=Steinernema hermaphroditum TaxID=289476 RepID=A0AA39HHE6_9BILA|nr:hypothetical protein QR680_017880 [Steinernema hermaphroditum]